VVVDGERVRVTSVVFIVVMYATTVMAWSRCERGYLRQVMLESRVRTMTRDCHLAETPCRYSGVGESDHSD